MRLFPILLYAFAVLPAHAQPTGAAANAPNPEFLNNVYYWPADSLQPLEKTIGQVKNKMHYFGGGSSPSFVIEGARSPVRLKSDAGARFAVKLSGMIDPSSMIKLYDSRPGRKPVRRA